jgi:hypothetical protein
MAVLVLACTAAALKRDVFCHWTGTTSVGWFWCWKNHGKWMKMVDFHGIEVKIGILFLGFFMVFYPLKIVHWDWTSDGGLWCSHWGVHGIKQILEWSVNHRILTTNVGC